MKIFHKLFASRQADKAVAAESAALHQLLVHVIRESVERCGDGTKAGADAEQAASSFAKGLVAFESQRASVTSTTRPTTLQLAGGAVRPEDLLALKSLLSKLASPRPEAP